MTHNPMKPEKKLPGWMRDREQSFAQRLDRYGRLERDVAAYNQAIRRKRQAERAWCEARRRVDALQDQRRVEAQLREVWDD